jgi:hypothetical protein
VDQATGGNSKKKKKKHGAHSVLPHQGQVFPRLPGPLPHPLLVLWTTSTYTAVAWHRTLTLADQQRPQPTGQPAADEPYSICLLRALSTEPGTQGLSKYWWSLI